MRVGTDPLKILAENADRSSYTIMNQHATVSIYVASGRSEGPHVATSGNHEGELIGPNGGQIFDNDDKDCVFAVATAVNDKVKVRETIKSFHTVEGAMKR